MSLTRLGTIGLEVNSDIQKIEVALVRFFSACDGIVGTEANYQVLLAAELEKEFPGEVRREYKIASAGHGGIDVVVVLPDGSPRAIFEIKGGAYSSRNALQDVFGPGGYCSDMGKLQKVAIDHRNRWLVAVDAIELGRSLSYKRRVLAEEEAGNHRVCFAYFAHGDESCILATPDQRVRYVAIDDEAINDDTDVRVNMQDWLFNEVLGNDLMRMRGSLHNEADIVGAMYRSLLENGYSPRQLATETYFGFAPGDMHQRPDLCVFNPQIDGHFNLHPEGDTTRTREYDRLKVSTLLTMIEVKGGKALKRRRDATLLKTYSGDIEKLSRWRSIVEQAGRGYGLDASTIDFVFIGVDTRPTPISQELITELIINAKSKGVVVRYVYLPE